MSADRDVYGLWLDRKGRVLGDSHLITGFEGDIWIVSATTSASTIREHLLAHIIADEVEIEDMTERAEGCLFMEGQRPPASGIARIFEGRMAGKDAWLWIGLAAPEATLLEGLTPVSREAVERRRILARVPSVPADIGPADLPQEGGLHESAISYSKGCYLGQEIMARLSTRGKVRRKLFLVEGGATPPPVPCAVNGALGRVGELRSAAPSEAGFVGLAMLPADLRDDASLTTEKSGALRIVAS